MFTPEIAESWLISCLEIVIIVLAFKQQTPINQWPILYKNNSKQVTEMSFVLNFEYMIFYGSEQLR